MKDELPRYTRYLGKTKPILCNPRACCVGMAGVAL